MKNTFIILFLIFLSIAVNAQVNDSYISRMGRVYVLSPEEMTEIDIFSLKENSKYFEDKWFKSKLKLKSGKFLEFDAARLDLANDEVEIFLGETIYSLDNQYLDEFIVNVGTSDERLFKRTDLKSGESNFLLQLVSGDAGLAKEFYFKKKKANYNAVLNTGSRKDILIQKSRYYMQYNGKMAEIPTKKKKAIKLFKKYFGEELINNLKVDPDNEESLKAFFVMVNSKL